MQPIDAPFYSNSLKLFCDSVCMASRDTRVFQSSYSHLKNKKNYRMEYKSMYRKTLTFLCNEINPKLLFLA